MTPAVWASAAPAVTFTMAGILEAVVARGSNGVTWTALAFATLLSFGGAAPAGPAAFDWRLPPGWSPPPVPADNPMNAAKVELGRRLFYDRRLSASGEMACASCHQQARGFSDGLPTHVGATGQPGLRNAMALANVGWFKELTWVDPTITSLEQQAHTPMYGAHPVEMGLPPGDGGIWRKLSGEACYSRLTPRAFPGAGARLTPDLAVKAIAAFERTLISADAPFDRYRRGDASAVSEQARKGMALFYGPRFQCAVCHVGPRFTDADKPDGRHAIGSGLLPGEDQGYDTPALAVEQGRYRTPSLRNVALSAPYLHDGSAPRLQDAIVAHRGVTFGILTADDLPPLVAFLKALTDETLTTSPRFGPPNLTNCKLPARILTYPAL